MPNWSYTCMTVSGSEEDIQKFRDFVYTDEKQPLDFNKIIPEPEELNNVLCVGDLETDMKLVKKEEAGEVLTDEEKERLDTVHTLYPDETKKVSGRDNAKLAIKCFEKYGYSNWFDWQSDHWGTKWNACEVEIELSYDKKDLYVHFQTAWDKATPIFKKMSEMFPTLSFCFNSSVELAEEEIEEIYEKGKLIKSTSEPWDMGIEDNKEGE